MWSLSEVRWVLNDSSKVVVSLFKPFSGMEFTFEELRGGKNGLPTSSGNDLRGFALALVAMPPSPGSA